MSRCRGARPLPTHGTTHDPPSSPVAVKVRDRGGRLIVSLRMVLQILLALEFEVRVRGDCLREVS